MSELTASADAMTARGLELLLAAIDDFEWALAGEGDDFPMNRRQIENGLSDLKAAVDLIAMRIRDAAARDIGGTTQSTRSYDENK